MLKAKQYAYSAIGNRNGITENEYGNVKTYSKSEAIDFAADYFYKTRGYRAMAIDVTEVPGLTDRINEALNLAIQYGGIDGDHHKAWVIDGIVRALAGEEYSRVVAEACSGEDSPSTDDWDIGTSP